LGNTRDKIIGVGGVNIKVNKKKKGMNVIECGTVDAKFYENVVGI